MNWSRIRNDARFSGAAGRSAGLVLLLAFILLIFSGTYIRAQNIGVADPGGVNNAETAPIPLSAAAVPEKAMGLQPFGANLFTGGFSKEKERGLNPNYLISEGDTLTIHIWGTITKSENYTVDQQGNIFLPSVGPVHLAGVPNSELNTVVEAAVKSVYAQNVHVYANLNTTQPAAVYVTGFVNRPGRYPGVASNSILYFIDKAGGISQDKGSYREIHVMRTGKIIGKADLYTFLIKGEIPMVQFRDDDTIVVGQRKGIVRVTGNVLNAHVFEFLDTEFNGKALAAFARVRPSVSHVQITGNRNQVPVSSYVPLKEFLEMQLRDGDQVEFSADERQPLIQVKVEGHYIGPSQYVLPQDTTLGEILDTIPVDPKLTDYTAVSLRRMSVATRQKQSLEEGLHRLENTYLLASSASNEEASIRVKEAQMIADFVKRARAVQPKGRVVIANQPLARSMLLEDGDIITLPMRSNAVLVSGEVLLSQALFFDKSADLEDYIERTGGFTEQADSSKVVVLHSSGEVETGYGTKIRPGDEILVLPKVPTKNVQLASTLIDIIYKIAMSSYVIVRTY